MRRLVRRIRSNLGARSVAGGRYQERLSGGLQPRSDYQYSGWEIAESRLALLSGDILFSALGLLRREANCIQFD